MNTLAYLEHWTYIGIFLLTLLGNMGVPFPEEAVFLTAGYLASERIVSIYAIIPYCILVILLTNNMSYWAARWFGKRIFKFLRKTKGIHHVVEKAEYLFRYHGKKTMFFSRFIWNVRNFTPLIAGATKMKWRDFQLYDFLAACIYTPILILLGFFFSRFLDVVVGRVNQFKAAIFVLFVVFVSFYVAKKFYCKLFR